MLSVQMDQWLEIHLKLSVLNPSQFLRAQSNHTAHVMKIPRISRQRLSSQQPPLQNMSWTGFLPSNSAFSDAALSMRLYCRHRNTAVEWEMQICSVFYTKGEMVFCMCLTEEMFPPNSSCIEFWSFPEVSVEGQQHSLISHVS